MGMVKIKKTVLVPLTKNELEYILFLLIVASKEENVALFGDTHLFLKANEALFQFKDEEDNKES